ncbi:hypothetical protein ANN_14215 [Periplaneta americana]|uniref:Uncharacterized protein n=1 Tax=Periplaneta americana TaxID=6978 RepID=A0ABQ8SWX5_PERAM|nr:hypothetical protein ANN_14215 [Periplaneta americana]
MSSGFGAEIYVALTINGLGESSGINLSQATCSNLNAIPDPLVSQLDTLTSTPKQWILNSLAFAKRTKKLMKCFVWSVALYEAETLTLRRSDLKRLDVFEMKKDESRITVNEMKFMSYTAGYTKWDHKRNEDVMEELQLEPIINHVKHYRNN